MIDGKEYTAAELATLTKRLADKDAFIETLKTETSGYRVLLDQATEKLKTAAGAAQVLDELNRPPASPAAPAPADAEAVATLVLQRLQGRDTAAAEQHNWDKANASVTAVYGEKAQEKVAEAAARLGYTQAEMVALARSKPSAFLELMKVAPVQPSVSTQRNGINTSALILPVAPTKPTEWIRKPSPEKLRIQAYQQKLKDAGL
ncbi:MAG: hypothetical protein M0P95_17760 [Sulfuritalea sp.]|nr:hypothetical protein [Sulfuritalea sp.]